MVFKYNALTNKLDISASVSSPPGDELTIVTDFGNAVSVNDTINGVGGSNILTAGSGDFFTINLAANVKTTSYETLPTNAFLRIENLSITALGTDTDVNIGIIPKGAGGVFVQNNLTVGLGNVVTTIPFGGTTIDVGIYSSATGTVDLGGIINARHVDSPSFGGTFILAKSRGTAVTPTTVQAGDILGTIGFFGYQGADYWSAGGMRLSATGTVDVGKVPGLFEFLTANAAGVLTTFMQADEAGRCIYPLQPAFSAYLSANVTNATGDGTPYTVAFNTEEWDRGSNFAANTFTAPIGGIYRFNWIASVSNLIVSHDQMTVTVGGRTVFLANPFNSSTDFLVNGSVDLALNVGATVTMVITVFNSTKTVTVNGTLSTGTFLQGQLQI